MSKSFEFLQSSSPVFSANATYLETLYEAYLNDSSSVSTEWQNYFGLLGGDVPLIRPFGPPSPTRGEGVIENKRVSENTENTQQSAVNKLISAYRRWGHLGAKLDPLSDDSLDSLDSPESSIPELNLSFYGLSEQDFATHFLTNGILAQNSAPLKEIYSALKSNYCSSIGYEYKHISNREERLWIREYIENRNFKISKDDQKQVLKLLVAADGVEKFLATKYVGQKRFSLEGGDSLIPLLHTIIHAAGDKAVKEIVMGMAHRGRINVLVNLLGLSMEELSKAFEGKINTGVSSGDVKYHMGFSSDIANNSGQPLHLSLAFNPSHLEFISSVVMGSTRARQCRRGDTEKREAMAILIHGDSAVSGQGVVMETLNMSQTRAYSIGGSVHIIINNQIGFTTSNLTDLRSTRYCSDVFKAIEAPIFHVNGDDPESVVFLAKLAVDYREKFQKDVVIDLVCYRRLGHNEADEPAATQPLMYQKIRKHPALFNLYAQKLITQKTCTQAEVDKLATAYQDDLQAGKQAVETLVNDPHTEEHMMRWIPYIGIDWHIAVDTRVKQAKLISLAKQLEKLPKDFELQRQVGLMIAARAKMTSGELPIDWGYAETLAYASLLEEGHSVRLVGQDVRRGTFAHRHAALLDQKTGECFMPLSQLAKNPSDLQIYDSVLSETGALGFEYGYAATNSESLVIWEAQFGDFANGAQVIIDQFISSAWQKWQRLCGLILFLPHGYEGMGPEHSSARLERYLQLCAQQNIQVCVPTTPAQIFHLIRRQVIRTFRKPLVVMTPKSLLRHKLAVSSLEELAAGQFQVVIPEIDKIEPNKVEHVLLCSGKVYYDLLAKRREFKKENTVIIRIEQLYPFPYDELTQILAVYTETKDIIWCQEEPKNQGAWYIKQHCIQECLAPNQVLSYVGRSASAAPAVGYYALHEKQQTELIEEALGLRVSEEPKQAER